MRALALLLVGLVACGDSFTAAADVDAHAELDAAADVVDELAADAPADVLEDAPPSPVDAAPDVLEVLDGAVDAADASDAAPWCFACGADGVFCSRPGHPCVSCMGACYCPPSAPTVGCVTEPF